MENTKKIKIHRNALAIVLLVMQFLLGSSSLKAQETMATFIQGVDTLVTYSNVPNTVGDTFFKASDYYSIRVKSAATNNQWVDVFVNYTYNRAFELPNILQVDGTASPTSTIQHYAKLTSGWTHSYGNIEINKNTSVDVEITIKNGVKIKGQNLFKAMVHPAQKASVATVDPIAGTVTFTITNPCQVVIDINGQMDDHHALLSPSGYPVHAISLFANPVIKKPTLDNTRTYYVEPGSDYTALRLVSTAAFDTMYFKPGIHNIGRNFKIYPGKTYYIPGDALLYGTMNNLNVPKGSYTTIGENIHVYGYGTVSQAKISHPYYVGDGTTETFKGIEIEEGLNWSNRGICIADPCYHSVKGLTGQPGMFSWVKVISWRANGDGLGGNTPAEDCFIRTQDDCSYARGPKKRCTFWKDANAAMFHLANIPENNSGPVIIEDCDVLYGRLRTLDGSNGGVFQQRGEGNKGVRNVNIIFRNFRVHDKLLGMSVFNLISYEGSADAPTIVGSSYKGMLFQNISIANTGVGVKQRIFGCAEAPWYGGLIFDNITIGGVKITADNYTNYFVTNKYVKYLLWAMPKDVTLTTNADASKGSVTRNPEQSTYLETTPVTLTAVGKSGYVFSHWSGDYTGTDNPAIVVVDKNMTITANFSDPDFSKPLTYSAPETGSITIPANVTTMTVECWGGGGAGGSVEVLGNARAGGGSGGNYSSSTINVIEGDVINYSVGAGGVGSLSGFANNSNSGSGGDSYAKLNGTDVVIAKGGKGGINRNATGTAASVVSPTDNLGTTIFLGGNGGNAAGVGTIGSGGGGSSAGPNSNGNNGTILTGGAAVTGGGAGGTGTNSNGTTATAGSNPGGGGAGAVVLNATTSVTFRQGASGGNGKIIFNFTLSPNSLENATALNAKISIYPNPATDVLNIEHVQDAIIRIYDMRGVLLYNEKSSGSKTNVDVRKFKSSKILLLNVLSDKNSEFTKIIVE